MTCFQCTSTSSNPACAMRVQTLNGGYLPNGYVVASASNQLSSTLPTAPVFTCSVAPGPTSVAPSCSCPGNLGGVAYGLCRTTAASAWPAGVYAANSVAPPPGVAGTQSATWAGVPPSPPLPPPPPATGGATPAVPVTAYNGYSMAGSAFASGAPASAAVVAPLALAVAVIAALL